MMVFGGETLGKELGHEGGAIMNGISVFITGDTRKILSLSLLSLSLSLSLV
jgi:hypothetical protein